MGTPILGKSMLCAEQLVSILPSQYAFLELAQIYLDLGEVYGLRGDLAFCQAMKETGKFTYRRPDGTFGNAKPYQNNFCGLGVTGTPNSKVSLNGADSSLVSVPDGEHGAIFQTKEAGAEAHIQHLYAYCCNKAIPTGRKLLDPRFTLVRSTGKIAATFEELNGRWAVPGVGYGESIVNDYYAVCQKFLVTTRNPDLIDFWLDAGHGGADRWNVGPTGYVEADGTLDITLRLGKILEASRRFNVMYTRKNDVNLPWDNPTKRDLYARCRAANKAKADHFLSIHTNAASAAAKGTESFFNVSGGKGEELANAIQKKLVSGLGLVDRKVKKADFVVIRETNMPATLSEIAFHSNPEEEAKLKDPAFRQRVAELIAEAIFETFKTGASTGTVTPPVTPSVPTNNEVENLKKELSDVKAELTQAKTKIASLEADIKSKDDKITSIKNSFIELARTSDTLYNQVTDLTNVIK